MMAAGAVDGPQVIALSSNDFELTFDGGGDWPVAGNTLGDHTIGAYVNDVGGDSGIFCLHTLDGDFDITATLTDSTDMGIGVAEITNDSDRTTSDDIGMYGASIESWMWTEVAQGAGANRFHHGNTDRGSYTYADGDVLKIERRGDVITFYKNDAEALEFPETSSNPVRLFIFSEGGSNPSDIDNILITDYEKVQRDGFFNEGAGTSRGWGGSSTERYYGFGFKATRTGTIESVKGQVDGHTANFASTAGLYPDSSGSPGSQIGSDSNTQTINGNATFTWTFASEPSVEKGRWYWMVFSDTDGGSGNTNFKTIGNYGDTLFRSGKAGAIGSITDHASHGDLKVEIKINATGEETPDFDTLLLIHSNTTDGSTTFVDSSQFGRTITVAGTAQHDTAQNTLGQSSGILLDGNSDYLTVPDSDDFNFETGSSFTIEVVFRLAALGVIHGLISKNTSYSSFSGMEWQLYIQADNKVRGAMSNNGGSGPSLDDGVALLADTWYHYAFVRVGDRYNLYRNGVSAATTTSRGVVTQNTSNAVVIGDIDGGASGFLNGWITEARVSRVARWDANFTPPSASYP